MRLENSIFFTFAVLLSACSASTEGKTSIAELGVSDTPDASTSIASDQASRDDSSLRPSYHDCVAANDGSTWDMQDCIEAEFVYQDSRLNSTYKALLSRLPQERRQVMKVEERAWIAEKDAACKWDAETEGQAQRIEANVCSLEKTAARAEYLEGVLQKVPSK